MANKSLFASLTSRLPRANAVNEAGGRAYKLEPKHALAQVAATGTFGNAFYNTAETQLGEVLKLIDEVDDNQYLAKLALYAREKAFMKDMPAALLVALSVRDTELMHQVFDRVVDNGRVLRTVFQMIRSGQFKNKARKGRVGLSSSVQRAFQRWLNTASVGKLLSASIGNDPSLRDILRMARPTPKDNARRAMFGWLTDKPIEKWAPATEADLPVEVQSLIAYRNSESEEAQALIAGGLDSVRWDSLSDAAKGPMVWAALARKMGPQALRMNLNTLLRHDVFNVAFHSVKDADSQRDFRGDRPWKRTGVAGTGCDWSGYVWIDEKCGYWSARSWCSFEDAMHRRGSTVRRGDPATQPGQHCDSVRYVSLRCQDGSKRFDP